MDRQKNTTGKPWPSELFRLVAKTLLGSRCVDALKPDSTILAKKRYLLGPNLPHSDAAWHGKLSVTAGAEGDMEFWIPKGANLFHFVGGARFIHGGAMPQEIVVPVVTVKQLKGKSALETKTRSVTVQVLGSNHRITTAQHRFQLIQMEAVSDRVNPGVMHTVSTGGTGSHLGLYRLETQVTAGNGTLKTSGLGSNSAAKEAIKVGFDYFKANAHRVNP